MEGVRFCHRHGIRRIKQSLKEGTRMNTPARVRFSAASLEDLAQQAQDGSAAALETLLARLQDKLYTLSVRMLWCPDDARDATQELLLRIATRLSSFRGESAFMTWVYRVAVNYLSTVRKGKLEDRYTFETFGQELAAHLSEPDEPEDPMQMSFLLEEIKIGCTIGMLLCLDRAHRIAYILGEILDLDSTEAAEILEIPPATFRKRLSRARADMLRFMRSNCGLIDERNVCRCRKRVQFAIETKRLNPTHLYFAHDLERAARYQQVVEQIRQLEESQRIVALYRSHPELHSPVSLAVTVKSLVDMPALKPEGLPNVLSR